MATEVDNPCSVNGPSIECPSKSSITWDGVETVIDTMITCPYDTVDQYDYIRASQLGLCDCDTAILGDEPNDPKVPVPCDCFACPPGSVIGHAIWCTQPLIGPCKNFSCDGTCDGLIPLNNNPSTFAPTEAPVVATASADGDAATTKSPTFTTLTVMGLFILTKLKLL